MYYSQDAKLVLYCEGELGKSSKTAEGVLRYGKNPVVAVIDSTKSGKTVEELTGIKCDVPILSSVSESLKFKPNAMLLGCAWEGGALPDRWRQDILTAINAKLDVINGLHHMLTEDAEFSSAAAKRGARLLDVRRSPDNLPVARARALTSQAHIVLTVGSDCSVGKMTVSLELLKVADKRGKKAEFVATGQTGIMIAGDGIAIDRVIGDFMAGATEKMVLKAGANADYVFVEGQGSIVHPGYSGVTLALLHGSCPQSMILVHNPSRLKVKDNEFPITSYERLIELYENIASAMRPAKVVGIALNTRAMSETEALDAIRKAEQETGLPATDAVRFGADKLYDAVVSYQAKLQGSPCK